MSIESGKPCSHPPSLHPSPLAFNLSQHQGLFQWVISSHQVAKYWSFSFSISPFNEYLGLISSRIEWFDLLPVQESSPTAQFKSISSSALSLLYGPISHPYMTTGKSIALTIWTFIGKVMSLLFNMLSRLVIAFLPRSKHLSITQLQSPSAVTLSPRK